MILMRSLQSVYAATIDRSKFREVASRVVVFVLPLFYFGRPIQWWGLVFVAFGILIRTWGAGFLQKDKSLAAQGPYVFVRHPLYLGSCLLALGLIVCLHHWFVTLAIGGVTFLIYNHTIRHEEKNLVARFGSSYSEYQKNVGPLWPKWRGIKRIFFTKTSKNLWGTFSFKQYMKNKEYECLLGVLTVFAILYLGTRF